MKSFITTALLIGVASQAAGCIIVSDDDDDTGSVNVTWRPVTAAADGTAAPSACPAGATTAIIYALRDGDAPGEAFQDKYDCTDGAGAAMDLPAGGYTVWVRFTDTIEAGLFAESAAQTTTVTAGGTSALAYDVFVDHGFYLLSWNLVPRTGGTVACSSVPNERGVFIIPTGPGGTLVATAVDCEEGLAPNQTVTRPIPTAPGGAQYTIAIQLVDAQDVAIADAEPILPSPDRALSYGNQFRDLGTVAIELP